VSSIEPHLDRRFVASASPSTRGYPPVPLGPYLDLRAMPQAFPVGRLERVREPVYCHELDDALLAAPEERRDVGDPHRAVIDGAGLRTTSPMQTGYEGPVPLVSRREAEREPDIRPSRLEGGIMGRDDSPDQPEGVEAPDPYTVTDDFVQNTTEMSSAARQASLAKRARAASRGHGEFRWYEFRARRRYRKSLK
jgi:hypothetical protein